jgi:hypothetical protein
MLRMYVAHSSLARYRITLQLTLIHGLLVEFYLQVFLPFSVKGSEMLASRSGRSNVGRTALFTR